MVERLPGTILAGLDGNVDHRVAGIGRRPQVRDVHIDVVEFRVRFEQAVYESHAKRQRRSGSPVVPALVRRRAADLRLEDEIGESERDERRYGALFIRAARDHSSEFRAAGNGMEASRTCKGRGLLAPTHRIVLKAGILDLLPVDDELAVEKREGVVFGRLLKLGRNGLVMCGKAAEIRSLGFEELCRFGGCSGRARQKKQH
jgi:hypothetical protein